MRTIRTTRRPSPWFLIVCLLLVVGLMLSLRTCSIGRNAGGHDGQSGANTVDVAIEYGPMALYRYDDTLGGFSYDLLRMLAADSVALKFHPVTTQAEAARGLASGRYDLVVASIPVTTGIDTLTFRFTAPVYLDRQVLVQRRDSAGDLRIRSQLDLAAHEVWVTANSPVSARLRNLSSEIGDTIFIVEDPAYGEEQLVIMTATGDIPCAVVTEATARALAADYPELDISTAVSFTQFQGWLARRADSEFVDRLDSVILAAKGTDAYRTLLRRYGMAR